MGNDDHWIALDQAKRLGDTMPQETTAYSDMCSVCGGWSEFRKEGRSIRETYLCRSCRSSLRYRGQAEAILKFYGTREIVCIVDLVRSESFWRLSIYEGGLIGPFRKYFAKLPGYRQSFFWEGVPRGTVHEGVECQDLMQLTYPDDSFDLVITSDMFEHVRRPYVGFGEVRRVLKPGGRHIFSIPVTAPMPAKTFYRVNTSGEEDIYLIEPHYHGDARGGRSLVYTDFGTDLLDELAKLGLATEILELDSPYSDLRRLLTFVSQKPVDAIGAMPARDTGLTSTSAEQCHGAPRTPVQTVHVTSSRTSKSEMAEMSEAHCNICGRESFGPGPGDRMSNTGRPPKCLNCTSMERHRVVRKVFRQIVTDEFRSLRALQFSNDNSIRKDWFRSYEISVYGEKNSLDLQQIDRPDESYDVILCNHVLEHIADDHAALRELFRIVSRDGFILITVPNPLTNPNTRDWGYPDEKIHGHYRVYGADILDLFREELAKAYVHSHIDIDPATGMEDIVYFFSKSAARTAEIRGRFEPDRQYPGEGDNDFTKAI